MGVNLNIHDDLNTSTTKTHLKCRKKGRVNRRQRCIMGVIYNKSRQKRKMKDNTEKLKKTVWICNLGWLKHYFLSLFLKESRITEPPLSSVYLAAGSCMAGHLFLTHLPRILLTQPWLTRSCLEMSQGRTPWWASSTIRCLTTSGRGLPFTNTPPSWFTPPCPTWDTTAAHTQP